MNELINRLTTTFSEDYDEGCIWTTDTASHISYDTEDWDTAVSMIDDVSVALYDMPKEDIPDNIKMVIYLSKKGKSKIEISK